MQTIFVRRDDLCKVIGGDPQKKLFEFAASGNTNGLRLAVAAGADINAVEDTKFGDTPLIWCAAKGHTQTLRAAVELGADINKENSVGTTPALCAAIFGHTETMLTALELGSSHIKNVLFSAAKKYDCIDTIRALNILHDKNVTMIQKNDLVVYIGEEGFKRVLSGL